MFCVYVLADNCLVLLFVLDFAMCLFYLLCFVYWVYYVCFVVGTLLELICLLCDLVMCILYFVVGV